MISAGIVGKYRRPAAAIRVRHFGPSPIIEDNRIRARPLTAVNARVGDDLGRVALAADLINALDAHDYEIEYDDVSRLPGDRLAGVADRQVKPFEPRQPRLSTTYAARRGGG